MAARKKLLLVEDEVLIALAEARVLQDAGYEVQVSRDGEAAVKIVRDDPSVDLVLMDIDLGPGLSGPDAAGRILEFRPLPIVFLTSHSEREMVETVRNITRYGYVIKNSGNFVLMASIEMAFELFEAHEEARRHAQRRAAMLEAIPDLVFTVGRDGVIRDYSAPPGIGLAVPREKVVGTSLWDLFPQDEAERQLALYRACLETGRVQQHSYEMTSDGHVRTFELRIARQDENLVLAVVREITERVESERRLRKVTAQYEYLFEYAPLPIVLLDREDRVVKANAAFIRVFGYAQEEASGREINDLVVPPEFYEEGQELTRRVAEGEAVFHRSVRRRKDGSPIRVAISAAPIELEGSRFIYAIYQPISGEELSEPTPPRG